MNGASKFQDDERFCKQKGHWYSAVGHQIDLHCIETLFLQRNVQSGVEHLVNVSTRCMGLVDYTQKRCFCVSDRHVFEQIAVDVDRLNAVSYTHLTLPTKRIV